MRAWFRPGARVLEIGGGSGFQAGVIASWGCSVVSLDLAGRAPSLVRYFDVQDYDGLHIEFPDESFDLIFSSNVLEHVPPGRLPVLLGEMRRVAKRGQGIFIHILPSPFWRFWTMLAYYPYLLRRAGRRLTARRASQSNGSQARPANVNYLMKHGWTVGPHGEYPNALAELYYYSRRRWRDVFERNGFAVRQVFGSEVFYTGYGLCPALSRRERESLCRLLGSPCSVFILE